jgi:hypothetical protein
MTRKEAIELYVKTSESFGLSKDEYFVDEPDDIADEMLRIVGAKSDRAASMVIEWWGCWEPKYTSTRWARRARQIAAGTYKP